jgi:hypothetical protein
MPAALANYLPQSSIGARSAGSRLCFPPHARLCGLLAGSLVEGDQRIACVTLTPIEQDLILLANAMLAMPG